MVQLLPVDLRSSWQRVESVSDDADDRTDVVDGNSSDGWMDRIVDRIMELRELTDP